MSESVGAFCHIKQDVSSYNASEGAQVSLVMEEYERERKLFTVDRKITVMHF